jgi:hypothetical protein
MTTLANIRTKVRRLTASPSSAQLTDSQIDEYVNTFYLHDLPQHLKLFSLKEVYTFYTEPNVDTYVLNIDPSVDPSTTLDTPAYYSVEPPVYIAGYRGYYTQSRSEFYKLYPPITAEEDTSGTNIAGTYTINITNVPVLRNQVTVSATDAGGNRLIAYDNGAGGFTGDITGGAINYTTGAITLLTFTGVIPVTENITVQSIPYVASRPSNILFYDNTFTVRPVPDKTYRIDIDAYIYPTKFLSAVPTGTPEPQFLWQLLAVGASRKVFEDRGDMESIATLEPLFKEQMMLCQRKTLQQNRPVRAATIYTNQIEGLGNLNYNNY